MRQPDETTCFTCGSTIKRDVRLCPQCGQAIAAGSEMQVRTFVPSAVQPASGLSGQQDVVGAGRYVINFFLAGVIGLVLTYLLRNYGWLATWICIPVLILALIVLTSIGSSP